MSRAIDFNDPESWDEDDKNYLKDRLEKVPAEHRHLLEDPTPAFAPALHAESAEMERLRLFLEENFADELSAEGETPVGLAIRLLEDYAGLSPEDATQPDVPGYEKWKSAELVAEIEKRRSAGRTIPGDKFTRASAAEALRADDATK